MILSDRESAAAVERGAIGIDPLEPLGSKLWTPISIDLRLDAEIRRWEEIENVGEDMAIDPAAEGFNANAIVNKYTQPADCTNGYVIGPKQFVLGWTIERIWLPHQSRIAGRVEGKSSLARIGLGIHVTAPTIHPGFGTTETKAGPKKRKGSPIRLEIWNCGTLPIKLTKGMPICQLILEEVHGVPLLGYTGQFRMQGPEAGKKRSGAPPRVTPS
jgi:dCTP deaminase